MDYNALLDLSLNLGYELAMSGAETFRVEESINRVLAAYQVSSDVFAIPNYLIVSIHTPEGQSLTRMRRIGQHGNDLDSVEQFSGLSRALCNRKPDPTEGLCWLDHVRKSRRSYGIWMQGLGYFLGAFGYALFFGGSLTDALCSGFCGLMVGVVDKMTNSLNANAFFRTIASSFIMSLLAYTLGAFNISSRPDTVIIGALMILVPGWLFTNSMRDIIYGDTNSGINRIVQVFLIAVALALGTAAAWNTSSLFFGAPSSVPVLQYRLFHQCFFSFIGCVGFSILFNVHGPGIFLCSAGGIIVWAAYAVALNGTGNDIIACFWGALTGSVFSEIMARIRKFPAITYMVVSIFPLIPGAGVYYTMNYAVLGQMDQFASKGMHTAAFAGILAVGILLGSTVFRMYSDWKRKPK